MPRRNARDATDSEETDSAARRAARRAASEIREMGNDTRDVPDPPVTSNQDDLNAGRRTSEPDDNGQSTPTRPAGGTAGGDTSETPTGGERPNDLNQGRRSSGGSNGGENGASRNPDPDERRPDDGETGLGDTPESPEAAQRQAVSSQLEKEFIRSNSDITERSQVDVENVRRTGDGSFTGDVVLNESGRDAVRQANRESIQSMGTTGREFARRQVEVSQERAANAVADDVRTDQFARQQLRDEFARSQDDLSASDVDVDVTQSELDVSLTEGGEQRQAVQQAANATEFSRDELTATVTEDGETSVQLTNDALRERAANENSEVSAGDLRVVEREFRGASERREGSTQRQVALTEEAERERFRAAVRDENPNAESIDITREDGELTANITGEGEVDRVVRLGENFANAPVRSTVEGVGDIASDSATALSDFGEKSIDTITNPVRTAESVSRDLASGFNREVKDITEGLDDAGDAVSDIAADPTGAATDTGEALFDSAVTTGEGIASFAGDVGERGDAITSTAAFAPVAGTASAAAIAEPTPFGEAAVAAGAVLGGAAITASVAGEEIADTTNDLTEGQFRVNQNELPIQAPNQAGSELDVGEEPASELDVGRVQPRSELSVGETFGVRELQVPDQTTTSSEVAIPGISLRQLQQSRQEQQQVGDSPETISREDIENPFAEPDQAPPSTRERMQRDDLLTPEREFPTGESAVVGSGTQSTVDESAATTPEVDAGETAATEQGPGSVSQPGILPGIDDAVGQGARGRGVARGIADIDVGVRSALDVESELQTQSLTETTSLAALESTLATGFSPRVADPTAQAFEFSPGVEGGGGSSRSADRPRLPDLSDLDASDGSQTVFNSEGVFSTGFRDVNLDDLR